MKAIARVETPADAANILKHWKERMRKHREQPLGFTEAILNGETMDNIDADVLAAVYNPSHPPFLNAYVRGRKHKDLRFFVRTRVGALRIELDSLAKLAHDLETNPAVQERVAREQFGMIRDGEVLYRVVPK